MLERLLKVGAYTEEETAIVMRQLLEACVYLKSRGIAHRDLKPDNLLLTANGRIKVNKARKEEISNDRGIVFFVIFTF